jgi:hypothetical protein
MVGYEISTELCGEFRGLLPDDAIRGCVREAMTDLRSSISPEALPEMAVRLARVRLTALAHSRAAQHSRRGYRSHDAGPGRRHGTPAR